MLLSTSAPLVTLIALAGGDASGQLAAMDSDGRVIVYDRESSTATTVHLCAAAIGPDNEQSDTTDTSESVAEEADRFELTSADSCPPLGAGLAWIDASLVILCADATVHRWLPGTARALADHRALPAWSVPLALTGGPELLIASSGAADALPAVHLIRYRADRATPVVELPPATRSITTLGTDPVAATTDMVWRLTRGRWQPIAEIEVCALASDSSTVFAAGPTGVWRVAGERIDLVAPSPAVAVAVAAGDLYVAEAAGGLRRVPVPARGRSSPATAIAPARFGQHLLALERRRRQAVLMPHLQVSVEAQRARQQRLGPAARDDLRVSVWLTWNLDQLTGGRL